MQKRRLKRRSLKARFNSALREFKNKIVEEQAYKEARGGGFEAMPKTLFENLNFNKIIEQGITRKVGNTTVRYTGEKAIQEQIKSLRARASGSRQKAIFVDNYLNSLRAIGMPNKQIEDIRKGFNRISQDYLTLLIDNNIVKQISYNYSGNETTDALHKQLTNVLSGKSAVSKELIQEYEEAKIKKQKLIPLVREREKILGR